MAVSDRRDEAKVRPAPPPIPRRRRASRSTGLIARAQGTEPGTACATKPGVVVREIIFGGVVLRVEHEGTDVVLVLPDGVHLLGTWHEASQLAAGLLLEGERGRRG